MVVTKRSERTRKTEIRIKEHRKRTRGSDSEHRRMAAEQ